MFFFHIYLFSFRHFFSADKPILVIMKQNENEAASVNRIKDIVFFGYLDAWGWRGRVLARNVNYMAVKVPYTRDKGADSILRMLSVCYAFSHPTKLLQNEREREIETGTFMAGKKK